MILLLRLGDAPAPIALEVDPSERLREVVERAAAAHKNNNKIFVSQQKKDAKCSELKEFSLINVSFRLQGGGGGCSRATMEDHEEKNLLPLNPSSSSSNISSFSRRSSSSTSTTAVPPVKPLDLSATTAGANTPSSPMLSYRCSPGRSPSPGITGRQQGTPRTRIVFVEKTVLSGHNGGVNACSFSPDNSKLASASTDKTVKIWAVGAGATSTTPNNNNANNDFNGFNNNNSSNGNNSNLLASLEGHNGAVTCVSWSGNGDLIASGSADKDIRLWEVMTSTRRFFEDTNGGNGSSNGASPTSPSHRFSPLPPVSGGEMSTFLRHEHHYSQQQQQLSPRNNNNNLLLDSVFREVTGTNSSNASDSSASILRSRSGSLPPVAGTSSLNSLRSSSSTPPQPVASTVVVASRSPSPPHTAGAAFGNNSMLNALADGSPVDGAPARVVLVLEDMDDALMQQRRISSFPHHMNSSIGRSASGNMAIGAGAARGMSSSSAFEISVSRSSSAPFHFSGGSNNINNDASNGGISFSVLKERVEFQLIGILRGHTDTVDAVAFSPDGKLLASSSADCSIRIWNVHDRSVKHVIRGGHTSRVMGVSWSPDSSQIASCSKDGTVCIWDASTGSERSVLRGHAGYVLSVDWSSDGNKIVSGGEDKRVVVWDTVSRERVTMGANNDNNNGDGDVAPASSSSSSSHQASVNCVRWSPDSFHIASGSADRSVRVWDPSTREEVAVLRGHLEVVSNVSWSGCGRQLASASQDKTIRIWNVGREYIWSE